MARTNRTDAEQRFRALYSAHGRAVLGFAVRRVAQPADAADVVAEAFTVAWRRLADVPAEPETRPWLFGVARRVVANQRRGELRRVGLHEKLRVSLGAIQASSPDPADALALTQPIAEAMARLPETDREVLRLAAWEELNASEIAMVLDVPAATVRTRLHRARTRLRSVLDEQSAATRT
ncbi:MAG: hypothetical protein QOF21_2787 [Actinomycetota bacterium]